MQEIAAAPHLPPSFTTYSGEVAGTAATVHRAVDGDVELPTQLRRDDDGEASFHFAPLGYDMDLPSPRMFPIFDPKALSNGEDPIRGKEAEYDEKLAAIGDQFRSLFVGDERDPPSSSEEEEEAEKPDGLPSGSYCVWIPKRRPETESSAGRCRKSRSTGSTANWSRLRDLILRRSNSDGKATSSLKFLNSLPSDSIIKEKREKKMPAKKQRATMKVSAQEVFYLRTKGLKEEQRRQSYLPYRRDLIGIFH